MCRLQERIDLYFLCAPVQCKVLKDFPPLAGVPHVCHVELLTPSILEPCKPYFEKVQEFNDGENRMAT